jgi:hypothetical protein
VIPTVIVWGLILGRWWRATLIGSAVVWPGILVVGGIVDTGPGLLGAALLAVANASLGVAVHQGVLWLVRRPWRDELEPSP